MKFLLMTLGSIGDFFPFLAVAEALKQRGHQPVIASNAGYAALARRAGFEFAVLWDRSNQSLDALIAENPARAWEVVHKEMFIPATGPARDCIAHYTSGGPCTVLASWTMLGAARAHAELGVPLCNVYLSPGAIAQDGNRQPDSARRRAIGFYPDWFAGSESGIEPTGFVMLDDALVPPLPAELEEFLQQGPPPIIFTPGSFMRGADGFFRESLAACEEMAWRAVFLTPYRAQLPACLPGSVRHFQYVPLERLAPRSAALVHHGGIGTCAQGLKAAIPQLVTPLFFDQPDNAARLKALGVGDMLAPPAYSRAAIGVKLRALIGSQDVRRNCARFRAGFDTINARERVCEIAESLAGA